MSNKKQALYETFHISSRQQYKIISEKNFTYANLLPILNSCLSKRIKNILDIGCGSGTISLYLASKGYQVKGIDISKKAIKICVESAKNMKLKNVEFETLDFTEKLPKGRYDLIYFSEVIEHLPDDEHSLRTIYKLLRPGGILLLSTPSKNAPLYRLGYANKFDKKVGHLRRYTMEELILKLKNEKFKIREVYKRESILRNFLFLNPIAGRLLRFIKYYIVDLFCGIDSILVKLFGESQIIIKAQKLS